MLEAVSLKQTSANGGPVSTFINEVSSTRLSPKPSSKIDRSNLSNSTLRQVLSQKYLNDHPFLSCFASYIDRAQLKTPIENFK